ncbi:MAG: citrate/2-methylcitrate synthase [Acidimicrobiales bacterium]
MDEKPGAHLDARTAAARLGVKVETLYAYVSRGLLHPTKPDGRHSMFDAAELDSLRSSHGRGDRAGRLEVPISTAITATDDHRLRYRGLDVATLLTDGVGFEATAELLWTGQLPGSAPVWVAPQEILRAVTAFELADTATLLDRLRAVVVAASATDPMRHDPTPDAVIGRARALIAAMVRGLGGDMTAPSIAAALWPTLTDRAPSGPTVAVLDRALVLLADHELAASTLAVRVAASTRADPYSCVLAGLGPMGGTLHGSAAREVRGAFVGADASSPAVTAGALVRDGRGLGHRLYPEGDPRVALLADAALAAAPDDERSQVVAAVYAALRDLSATHPNVDVALAVTAELFEWRPDAPGAVFALARSAGWIAHMLEELTEEPLRFRPVVRYTGPA